VYSCARKILVSVSILCLSVSLSLVTIRFIIHGLFLTVSASAFVTLQFQISRDHFRSDAVRQVGSAIIGQLDPSAGSAKETGGKEDKVVSYDVKCGFSDRKTSLDAITHDKTLTVPEALFRRQSLPVSMHGCIASMTIKLNAFWARPYTTAHFCGASTHTPGHSRIRQQGELGTTDERGRM